MQNFDGKTFVAWVDLSGFKELMKQKKAWEALNYFFNLGYDILSGFTNLSSLFVSDSGIIYCHNSQQSEKERLLDLLSAIQKINLDLLSQNYLTKCSIAFGDFKYQNRIELTNLSKSFVLGDAYVNSYLDLEDKRNKLEAGQCRISKQGLPNDLKLLFETEEKKKRFIVKKREKDQHHYYFYWMLDNDLHINEFEQKYQDTYNLQFRGIIEVLKDYSKENEEKRN